MTNFPPKPVPQSSTKGPPPSQSTKTTSGKGQNRPIAGGKAGQGKRRGQAPFQSATAATTMDKTQPWGALTLTQGQNKFSHQQRQAKANK